MILFLAGDVMTGRGVDQVLASPCSPELGEPWVRDAREYVALAERANGPIPRPVEPAYVWGDALAELERAAPDARIVNLETAVTTSDDREDKGINYRMHPANAACFSAAHLDVCALANNHVLDYGPAGLAETLATLASAGIRTAGAGRDLAEARRPAVVELTGGGRVLVFACGTESSGIPRAWGATEARPGVHLLDDLSDRTAAALAARAARERRPGDVVVVSIHWGSNWGYEVPADHVRFAHALVDGGVDVVHGHSSHHPRPIEVYRGRLVLHGCGDLVNDYEGIGGYEEFRGDLVAMYLARIDAETGRLLGLRIAPLRLRRMRLERAEPAEAAWLAATLGRISAPFGARVARDPGGHLVLRWRDGP